MHIFLASLPPGASFSGRVFFWSASLSAPAFRLRLWLNFTFPVSLQTAGSHISLMLNGTMWSVSTRLSQAAERKTICLVLTFGFPRLACLDALFHREPPVGKRLTLQAAWRVSQQARESLWVVS